MSNFSSLKAAIQQYIKTNGNEEITGAVLQDILLSMVSVLGDTAINDLETALQTETTNRTNADGTLQQNINNEAMARGNADTALGNRLTAAEGAITTINTMLGEGYVYAGLATTSTNPGTPTGKVFYIATAAGTYTYFSGIELTYGINILKYNGSVWTSEQVTGIDDIPTAGSNNLVKSGGVFKEVNSLEYSLSSTGLPILAGYGRKNATMENTMLKATGEVVTQVDFNTSPLCEIPEGTTTLEWVGLFPHLLNNCGLCIYDENGGFLAAVAGSTYNTYNGNDGKFDLTQYPSAKFLRFTPFSTYSDHYCYILCSKGDVDINSLLNGHVIGCSVAPHADATWIFQNYLDDRGDIFVNFHSPGNRIEMGIYDRTDRKWLLEELLWNEEFRYVSIPEGHSTQVFAWSLENDDVPVALEILPKSAINDILITMKKKNILIGQGKDYTTLREGIRQAYNRKNAMVYVYPGVYDLISEFAAEIEAHTGYTGIGLGNGMHVIFMPGAYVKANYVPSGNEEKDNWVEFYFQPFWTDKSDFIIENLDIEASNTRYCVHDELAGNESQYIHRFVNCHMKFTNTYRESPNFLQCIGGGIGKNAYIEVVGGMYESYNISDTNHTAISYHNGNNENADSVFIVRDAYIANNNYIRFGAYGPSTIPVRMYVSGCSMGGYIRNVQEIPGRNATLAELIEWNNTIR